MEELSKKMEEQFRDFTPEPKNIHSSRNENYLKTKCVKNVKIKYLYRI